MKVFIVVVVLFLFIALLMGIKMIPEGGKGMFRASTHAPELIGGEADWINSPPLNIKNIRGKVVLVDFWDYTCVNCIRTLPYVNEWHKRYAKDGLVIIGVHTPEFEFAKNRANVLEAVKHLGVAYPVLVDSLYKNWDAYANHYWPAKYLIDKDGLIVYEHFGEGNYGDTEARIQQLLKKANPHFVAPPLMGTVRGSDKPGAVCYPTTHEIYAGYSRGELGNSGGLKADQSANYVDSGNHREGILYASGQYLARSENILHSRQTVEPEDYIALKYRAKEVNAVIKSEKGATFRVYLTQDGKPIGKEDKGEDVLYDEQGRSYIQVTAPRMYNLVINNKYGDHDLHLSSPSDSFALYSFTFSSCEVPGGG